MLQLQVVRVTDKIPETLIKWAFPGLLYAFWFYSGSILRYSPVLLCGESVRLKDRVLGRCYIWCFWIPDILLRGENRKVLVRAFQ